MLARGEGYMSARQTGTFRLQQCQSQKAAHAKLTKESVIIERDFARESR
jgi:hypothetical protein